jgi:hypothetical protein
MVYKMDSCLYLDFIVPLGRICHNTACDKQLDYYKIKEKWVELATDLLEDDSSIKEYSDLIAEYILFMFAYKMTYILNPTQYSTTTLKTKSSLPPRECYAFIKVMAAIYDKIENKSLCPTIYKALEEWLEDNRPVIKFAGKR